MKPWCKQINRLCQFKLGWARTLSSLPSSPHSPLMTAIQPHALWRGVHEGDVRGTPGSRVTSAPSSEISGVHVRRVTWERECGKLTCKQSIQRGHSLLVMSSYKGSRAHSVPPYPWGDRQVIFCILLTMIGVLCPMSYSYTVFSRESESAWGHSVFCILRPLISIFN